MTASAAAYELEKNRHQGHYGETYVAAIAAAAGFDVLLPRLGDGFDLQVLSRGPRGTSGSHQIAIQVKSWSAGTLSDDGYYHYPLKVSAYNALAGKNDVRHYLGLCIVPPEVDEYSDAQHARLKLKFAAYWLSLKDMKPLNESVNPDSTRTVLVPTTHLVTAKTIRALVYNEEARAVVT